MHWPPRSTRAWLVPTLMVAMVSGCAVSPPREPDDLCAIFYEKDDWYDAAKSAHERWGTPIPVSMAIMYHESGFRDDARPPRTWLLGFIPWTRPSSAYGFSQALDGTWDWYQDESGNDWADRDDFDDAVDFVAWYVAQSHAMVGIAQDDAYHNYLAYHEGQGGYARRSYLGKTWLLRVAARVQTRAQRYARQLQGCREELEDDGWWFW